MSAKTLRQAAALMRERAEGRTRRTAEGPYALKPDSSEAGMLGAEVLAANGASIAYVSRTLDDADHIASWHPAVARAVADWLEGVAAWADEGLGETSGLRHTNWPSMWGDVQTSALTVARAYLGEAS